ncbi:MAG: hypothetical protein ABJA83_09150 [Burkholderiaceae bacterium]
MSELRWTLLLVAAALLVALYVYGKWQERRYRIDDAAAENDADSNPSLSSLASASRHARHAPPRIEPTMGMADADSALDRSTSEPYAQSSEEPVGGTHSVGGWIEDPLLDLMLELRCVHAFDGVAALEARGQLDRLALPLPIHLAVWDGKAARWSLPDRFGFYSEMLIAVQLATRRAALGEIDATRFIATVQQIAVSIDADFDSPDVTRIVQQAAELDRLCARFDVQITLTLEALTGAWSVDEVDAAARQAQLVRVKPGCWQLANAVDAPLLSMTTAAPTPNRLAITLDVPSVVAQPLPLPTLFATARNMADRLGARVVDDNGRAVESAAQSAIEVELERLTAEMRAASIEPGSRRARRLYSD